MVRLGKVDPNSYAEPERIATVHSDIKWKVDFANTKLIGSVTHRFNVLENNLDSILLDVRDLSISDVSILTVGSPIPVNYIVSDRVEDIGSKLTLNIPCAAKGDLLVKIDYETSSKASGLQWLQPEQTLGKKHPYMFSQCQAIHARSLLPCQDTPSVKFTYNAVVEHPKELRALMSALIDASKSRDQDGISGFKQEVPIPAYLLAIVVAKLVSRTLGPTSRVWSEEGNIEECAEEFSETPKMLETAEEICGPYVWKQYDLLVMPPSFPFGGMENPCLTFVTPTIIAGDKSLTDVIAHEISHSWTGNLVTNKNFEHFWLNEGFTVFVEGKVVGRMYGSKARDFHTIRNLTELDICLRTQLQNQPELTKLIVDLSNIGPDDAFSSVPYDKGSTFLRYIEDTLGGAKIFEPFFRAYLQKFAYKSVVTDDFKEALYDYYKNTAHMKQLAEIDWDLWLYGEGKPPLLPKLDDSLAVVSKQLFELWSKQTTAELLENEEIKQTITIHQLLDFLSKLVEFRDVVDLTENKINLLEETYNLKGSKNAEVLFYVLSLCILGRLEQRLDDIFNFLNSNYRMRFSRPLYRELALWPEAKPKAIANFQKKRNEMMAVCSSGIEKDLGLK